MKNETIEIRRSTFSLTKTDYQRLQHQAVDEERAINDIIEEAITDYLGSKKAKERAKKTG